MEEPSHSFYRTILSSCIHFVKPVNNYSFGGNNLFQVRIQKLVLTYKFLEEKCFRLVKSVRQRKTFHDPMTVNYHITCSVIVKTS